MEQLYTTYYTSPIGYIKIQSNDKAVFSVGFVNDEPIETTSKIPSVLMEAKKQIAEYFSGKLRVFSFRYEMNGTCFQQKVWSELIKIPYGETVSYGEIAKKIGDKNKSRAVGMANHNNPIGIVVPCHRVIGANGRLTGYAGGLWRKRWLIEFEQLMLGN